MSKICRTALIIFATLLLAGCGSFGKYEGKTAEEWFNLYDEEEAENRSLRNQLSDMEYERTDLQNQVDDLESEKSDLEDEFNELGSCVEDNPHNAEYECL